MTKLMKKRSRKSGLPPGTLVHIGEKKTEEIKITVMDYDETSCREEQFTSIEACFVFKDKPSVTWINVEGLHNIENIQKLGDCYGFHPLVLEDILNTDQRPKIEDFDAYLYIVLKMLHNGKSPQTVTEQISLILGPNYVISFQEGIEGDVFNSIRERIRTGKGRIRTQGADYLAYSLIDAIVDNYFVVIEKMGERIEDLEDELIKSPVAETLQEIHDLKREMIFLRKAVWPLREVISSLGRGESPLIKDPTRIYLRDVYDHTIQVIDAIETSRDMLSGMLDIYLSSMSHKMNEVVKFLTIIGTIFIPLTFLAGVYGMNFEHMPELKWRWGYFVLWAVMSGMAVFMLLYFKKKKWL
ncbi:MAG: magnesium/cobalt transporter CorA [Nitrospirae bacterium]|nr:magnesium/cobalt transporter CorA [Nitrospirota bacterium]MCL5420960.1 magnesium/cobalt transporter CorA [Nitrospirota bacterium]